MHGSVQWGSPGDPRRHRRPLTTVVPGDRDGVTPSAQRRGGDEQPPGLLQRPHIRLLGPGAGWRVSSSFAVVFGWVFYFSVTCLLSVPACWSEPTVFPVPGRGCESTGSSWRKDRCPGGQGWTRTGACGGSAGGFLGPSPWLCCLRGAEDELSCLLASSGLGLCHFSCWLWGLLGHFGEQTPALGIPAGSGFLLADCSMNYREGKASPKTGDSLQRAGGSRVPQEILAGGEFPSPG